MESMCVYPLQQINDEHVMPNVIVSRKFKDKDIQRIYYCQIYLSVTTIADVPLANSKQLDLHMYKGERSLHSSVVTHMKINQQKPGSVSWGMLHKAMALWTKEYDLEVPLKE
eukprot:191807-Ditylum_brightwellii.AAC.1